MQRVGDEPGADDVVDGDGIPVHGVGVEPGELANTDRDLGQLLGRGAELVHVPLGGHGVGTHQRVAEGGLVLRRAAEPLDASTEPARAETPTHPGELVRAVGDEDRVAQALSDRSGRMLNVELERRAAGHGAVDVAMVDAEVLGHRHGVVDHHSAAATGVEIAVDLVLGHATVGQRPLHGLGVVLHAVEVRRLRVVAQARADDHGRPVRHREGAQSWIEMAALGHSRTACSTLSLNSSGGFSVRR